MGDDGIDCRYCHTSVESSAYAGIPPTKTCMNCHSVLFNNVGYLEPVRESYRTDQSIEWVKVHRLADYVYFNHSIHINKGIGCSSCHGSINQMPLVFQASPLTMSWCLDCHRDPQPKSSSQGPDFQYGLESARGSGRSRTTNLRRSTKFGPRPS